MSEASRYSKSQKLAFYGVSASVIALFSYYVYSRFLGRGNRSGSTSSDSGDDRLLLGHIKHRTGAQSSPSPNKTSIRNNTAHQKTNKNDIFQDETD